MEYNENYVEHLRRKTGVYDVMRPLRQHFSTPLWLLPNTWTLVDFAIGQVEFYQVWKRHFPTVYAYDINPAVAKRAQGMGLGEYIFEQDVSRPFTPRCHADIAVSLYLFEHLHDDGVIHTIDNMTAHAPLHLVKLTAGDDPRYLEDDTHCNPRNLAQWSTFLRKVYGSRGWVPIEAGPYATWSFATPQAHAALRLAEHAASTAVQRTWRDARL